MKRIHPAAANREALRHTYVMDLPVPRHNELPVQAKTPSPNEAKGKVLPLKQKLAKEYHLTVAQWDQVFDKFGTEGGGAFLSFFKDDLMKARLSFEDAFQSWLLERKEQQVRERNR